MSRGRDKIQRKKTPLAVRFWEKVERRGPDECWEWTGTKTNGYGYIKINTKRNNQAPRVPWELHNGAIPDGMCVCHHCDNPGCVNPSHLFLGTPLDNMRDMWEKGRGRSGDDHHSTKLTEEDLLLLRDLHAHGAASREELANGFNLSYTYVCEILNGKARC